MEQTDQTMLTFRCLLELESILPRPMPAVLGLPDWFKAMPQKAFNPITGQQDQTVKRCPPFIDAMTYGFLIPLPVDLRVHNGEFSWDFDAPRTLTGKLSLSPIDFHDPSQITGTPFFDNDRYIIKFVNFWTIQTPPGYSLFFTHPVNRADLPFTTLSGLVDCDTFYRTVVNFPARWHDPNFNGVLCKGTPVVQCLPVKRENWTPQFDVLSENDTAEMEQMRDQLLRETAIYRRQFRAPKR
jgi:hypothetical protein